MLNIENNYKFNNNDIIIVGCSGGPDSMALLDMLIKIRDKYNLTIIVAHVNYNVREESVLEENYVKDYSESNNLIFEGLSITEYSDDNSDKEESKEDTFDFEKSFDSKDEEKSNEMNISDENNEEEDDIENDTSDNNSDEDNDDEDSNSEKSEKSKLPAFYL